MKEEKFFPYLGTIFNPFSIGTNELIQQGAKLVTSAEDILEEISIKTLGYL